MKLLLVSLISISIFISTGCSQTPASVKAEVSNTQAKETSNQLTHSRLNWKSVARAGSLIAGVGILAAGLGLYELAQVEECEG